MTEFAIWTYQELESAVDSMSAGKGWNGGCSPAQWAIDSNVKRHWLVYMNLLFQEIRELREKMIQPPPMKDTGPWDGLPFPEWMEHMLKQGYSAAVVSTLKLMAMDQTTPERRKKIEEYRAKYKELIEKYPPQFPGAIPIEKGPVNG